MSWFANGLFYRAADLQGQVINALVSVRRDADAADTAAPPRAQSGR
jgi:hypothetical protein